MMVIRSYVECNWVSRLCQGGGNISGLETARWISVVSLLEIAECNLVTPSDEVLVKLLRNAVEALQSSPESTLKPLLCSIRYDIFRSLRTYSAIHQSCFHSVQGCVIKDIKEVTLLVHQTMTASIRRLAVAYCMKSSTRLLQKHTVVAKAYSCPLLLCTPSICSRILAGNFMLRHLVHRSLNSRSEGDNDVLIMLWQKMRHLDVRFGATIIDLKQVLDNRQSYMQFVWILSEVPKMLTHDNFLFEVSFGIAIVAPPIRSL